MRPPNEARPHRHLQFAFSRAFALEKPLLDQLQQNTLQSAFQILRRDYIRRDELTFEELNRAALQGLLERLNFGAEIVPSGQQTTTTKPYVHAEFLAPDIAYLRPESFAVGEAALFEKELTKLVEQKARHLILDLRGTRSAGLFEEAALMLQCFVPMGELMFKMKQIGRDDAELYISKHDQLWKDNVIVLVDGETNNAGEAFAACLKQRGRALIIGEPTRGAAVRHTEIALDDHATLRYASAEMLLPDGGTVFKQGLPPAHVVRASMDEKRKVFDGSRDKSMKPFIVDRVRPRFNERALVGIQNPELDDYVRRSNGQPLPGDGGQVRDVVTQRAIDLIQGTEFAAQSKINWNVKPQDLAPRPEVNIPKAIPANPAKP